MLSIKLSFSQGMFMAKYLLLVLLTFGVFTNNKSVLLAPKPISAEDFEITKKRFNPKDLIKPKSKKVLNKRFVMVSNFSATFLDVDTQEEYVVELIINGASILEVTKDSECDLWNLQKCKKELALID